MEDAYSDDVSENENEDGEYNSDENGPPSSSSDTQSSKEDKENDL
jgi:hypothetical protein